MARMVLQRRGEHAYCVLYKIIIRVWAVQVTRHYIVPADRGWVNLAVAQAVRASELEVGDGNALSPVGRCGIGATNTIR